MTPIDNPLTRAAITIFAQNAGFSGPNLSTAAAIALAESGGDPDAYDPETAAGAPAGKGSVGLWQIFQEEHPELAGWNLKDPQVNACAANLIFQKAKGFTPWSTFTSGKYKTFLPPAVAAPEPGGVL